jgi:hypothetical protein
MPFTYISIEFLAIAFGVVGYAAMWDMGLFNEEKEGV